MKSKRHKPKKSIVTAPQTETLLCIGVDTATLPVYTLPKSPWLPRVLLAFALLSGIGLMVPVVSAGALALDEHGTYWLVGPENPGTLWQRSLDYENIPPLSPLLQRQLCYLFGTNELSLRSLSILSYLLAIAAVYLLARELMDPIGASLAANILAWHPRVLGEVRIARCYGLTLLLATLAFWATLRWSRKLDSWWLVPWVLLNSALLWTHYLNAPLVVAQVAWLIWSCRHSSPPSLIALLAGSACVMISAIPLFEPIVRIATWSASFSFQAEQPILRVIGPHWWLGLPAGCLVGQFWMARVPAERLAVPKASMVTLLLAWGLLPTVFAAIGCQGDLSSLANPRYRMGFYGPSACLLAALLCYRRSALAAVLSVAVALSLGWLLAPRLPWDLKRIGHQRDEEWRVMAQTVEQHGQDGEPVFVQSGLGEGFIVPIYFDDMLFQDYAACRMGRFYLKSDHPRFALPYLWDRSDKMVAFYEDLLRSFSQSDCSSLWIASATDTDLNRRSWADFEVLVRKWGYEEVRRHESANAVLIQYNRQSDP